MSFNYKKIIKILLAHGKRREAGFIQKFYLEHKTRREIMEEMYLNSPGYYYNLKSKIKKMLGHHYGLHQFLDQK